MSLPSGKKKDKVSSKATKACSVLSCAVLWVGLGLIAALIFGNSMTKPLGHDEHMYCTAGYMLERGQLIYRDFSYVAQLPWHPLICAALFKVLDTDYYLFTVRAFSALCDILVVICLAAICRRIFSSFVICGAFFAVGAAVLYVFNDYVDYAVGFAWNHSMLLLCVITAYWLFIRIDFKHKPPFWSMAFMGALLSVATFSRPTTVLVHILFLIDLLLCCRGNFRQRLQGILPFVIGSAILAVWPVWVIAKAPEQFWLNVFRIPVLNGRYLHEIGLALSKKGLAYSLVLTPSYLVLVILTGILAVAVLRHRGRPLFDKKPGALLASGLAVLFLIIAFIPVTVWPQYLAIPVPFILISFAYAFAYLRAELEAKKHRGLAFRITCYAMFCSVLICVWLYPTGIRRALNEFRLANWVPLQVHRIAQDISAKCNEPKLVLTLSPLYAIEGGCDIYPELAAGPFVYRVADRLSEKQRQIARAVGPEQLAALIEERAASAIVVGTEPAQLEKAIMEVIQSNWEGEFYGEGAPVAYFRR